MLRLAALAFAAASAAATSGLAPSSASWDRVTVTLSGDGVHGSCRYESSSAPGRSEACEVEQRGLAELAGGNASTYTRITFERRFTPDQLPEKLGLQPGDQLLGTQVMAVAIDGGGIVRACQVIASRGDLLPAYGCNEARAERFEAGARAQPDDGQVGFITVLVYGHSAQFV